MAKHKVVVGLGFGDEGKGTIVDYLTSEEDFEYVVRFSGGPQAAHNVVTADGRHHTFAQFGSGSFNGVPTILSRFMLVNPFNLAAEAEALAEKIEWDPFDMLTISENCLVITPWHVDCNKQTEDERGEDRHGSCGQGVGVAQKFALDYPDLALRMKDLYKDRDSLVAQLMIIRSLLNAEYGNFRTLRSPGNLTSMYKMFLYDHQPVLWRDDQIAQAISAGPCLFEGSQGALLDEWKGFHPYTTWSTTTSENALTLLTEAGVEEEDIEVIGVTRSYHTRHGAGPFPSEDKYLSQFYPEEHNQTEKYQGAWRVGALDLELLDYGAQANLYIDSVAVTHMDREMYCISEFPEDEDAPYLPDMAGDLKDQERISDHLFRNPKGYYHGDKEHILAQISNTVGTPISILSYGPRTDQKQRLDIGAKV